MMLAVPQQSDIEGLVGVKIDGIIGTDIMQKCGDVLTGYGSFEAELHAGSIAVAGVGLGVCDIATAPYYDSILGLIGVSAFIGTNALRDSTILLSYSRNKIFISTTEN